MPSDTWTQAVYAQPPRICGRQLLAFSLGHSLLLRALDSPYAYVGERAGLADVLTATEICSRTTRENGSTLFGGAAGTFARLVRAVRWRGAQATIADESMRVYLSDFTSRAPRRADTEGDPLVAPVEFHLHRNLCAQYGLDHWAAWDCPMALAWAYFDAQTEWQGGKALMSTTDAKLAELDARMQSAHAAGDKATVDAVFAKMAAVSKAGSV